MASFVCDLLHCEETVLKLVAKAEQIIKKALNEDRRATTSKSSYSDLVTETDQEVEKILIRGLKKIYPNHRFIGEESVAAGEKCELTDHPTWIIDPVDGTTNFVHNFPHVAISIALAVQKELELGIIHDVYNNKTYIGRRGKGAYYDGERLQVTPVQDLKEAMIISELGSSRDVAHMDKVFRNLRNVGSGCRGMRCLGSAALNMCLVAKGISHSYYEYGIHCWDIAAGALIVREAGGVVLDPNGGPLNLMSRRVLCGSDVSLCSQISSRLTHIDLEHD